MTLGTLTFGNETSETDSFARLDRFLSVGGTLIDTADVCPAYPYGERGQTQRGRRISGGRF
jgi:aryl-alcohol dehydrogenase-like predicted oxidoreductase